MECRRNGTFSRKSRRLEPITAGYRPATGCTDDRSVASAINDAKQRFGAIDVLINNAGVAIVGPLEATSMTALEQNFQTNFFGLVRVTQAILPLFRQQERGLIVNISSLVGRFGIEFDSGTGDAMRRIFGSY